MSHEHPPTPETREEILSAIQELIEEQRIHNETPDPKDADRIKKIEELRKFLRDRDVNPDNVDVNPEIHAQGAHNNEHHSDEHGHGEETKKSFWKKLGGVAAVGGGLFSGLLSIFATNLWNTLRGKEGGGGGGGKSHGGGGGHGGGSHH